MVKHLSFHNSSFALRYFFNVKNKATVWHTPCFVLWSHLIPAKLWGPLLQIWYRLKFLNKRRGWVHICCLTILWLIEAKAINFRLILLLEINQYFIKLIISQYSFLESCMHYNLEDDLIWAKSSQGPTSLRLSFCMEWIINFLQSMPRV
jgi:hypothetical protein